mmetsp:Transcript_1791/g.2505  ORF Transcript_1791/g.2505 Transcript_1791/m.2505 type:complete len:728 (-) Transcript_1791:413-2596(-)
MERYNRRSFQGRVHGNRRPHRSGMPAGRGRDGWVNGLSQEGPNTGRNSNILPPPAIPKPRMRGNRNTLAPNSLGNRGFIPSRAPRRVTNNNGRKRKPQNFRSFPPRKRSFLSRNKKPSAQREGQFRPQGESPKLNVSDLEGLVWNLETQPATPTSAPANFVRRNNGTKRTLHSFRQMSSEGKRLSRSTTESKRSSRSPSPGRRPRFRRRKIRNLPDGLVNAAIESIGKDELLFLGDKRILGKDKKDSTFSITYTSKGNKIGRMPRMHAKVRDIRPGPESIDMIKMKKNIVLDLNNAYHLPFTRYIQRNFRHSFILDFDLSAEVSSRSPHNSAFSLLDVNKLRLAETLTSFVIGNHTFEHEGLVNGFASNGLQLEPVSKYQVYLVPHFIMKGDSQLKFVGEKMENYMQDYLKLNTEWSFANPDLREKMKAKVTGVMFKVYILPEKLLGKWAESMYKDSLTKKKLHLVLDLDKTLIRAFNEDSLDSINELRRKIVMENGLELRSSPNEKKDALPRELRGTESFKISFMFYGKKRVMWVKPRPFLREFLQEASKHYDISILSMGVPQYLARVMEGLEQIYPGIQKLIPPDRVMSSAYTHSKARKGHKDLRMLFPFCRFSDRRNTVAIVDDTLDVWDGREKYHKMVYPISRYEGLERFELCPEEAKSALETALKRLVALKVMFFKEAEAVSKSTKNVYQSESTYQSCRKVKVSEIWPVINRTTRSRLALAK